MTVEPEKILRRQYFWSARTLRCDVWVADEDLGEVLARTEDCLSIGTRTHGILAHPPYDTLIPELLGSYAESQINPKTAAADAFAMIGEAMKAASGVGYDLAVSALRDLADEFGDEQSKAVIRQLAEMLEKMKP